VLQNRCPNVAERAPPQATLPLRKNSEPGPLPSRWNWARGAITSSEGACCQGHYPNTSYSKSPSQPVTEASEQAEVTATRKTARPQKSEPKITAAPKPAAGKSKKKAAASVKTAAAKPTTPKLAVPNQSSTSPLEENSDLLDHLPIHACVELTCRLLTSMSALPTGAGRPRDVLKTVILFVAEYGSTP
jgi:hypothetical protein